jgi:hypothetical protein
MTDMHKFPQVMQQAHEDLLGNVSGRFSPEDWVKILTIAQTRWSERHLKLGEQEAWASVIRDFHHESYWGFTPNYHKPKTKKPVNLGVHFIGFTFLTFTMVLMTVAWLGQIYTHSDEASDKWIFFLVLSAAVGNIGLFLWWHRRHTD